jgi:hypothetical protein
MYQLWHISFILNIINGHTITMTMAAMTTALASVIIR